MMLKKYLLLLSPTIQMAQLGLWGSLNMVSTSQVASWWSRELETPCTPGVCYVKESVDCFIRKWSGSVVFGLL